MKWIDKCLSSLRKSTYPVSMIVVDNNSQDGTAAYIKTNFSEVLLIEVATNLGFGQANNIGIRRAFKEGFDFVFLLNQDTWISENTIPELLNAAVISTDFGILSPFHLDKSEKLLEKQFEQFLAPQYTGDLVSDIFFNRLKIVHETTYIHAAAWFISKACIETVGGFDPIYFHYGEDDDYIRRARYFKFKIGLVPSAQIVHDTTFTSWKLMEYNENWNTVFELHKLKAMSPHFRTNLLIYFKTNFDEITTWLLYRKFKKLKFKARMLLRTLKNLKGIYSSYKQSFEKGAFLN